MCGFWDDVCARSGLLGLHSALFGSSEERGVCCRECMNGVWCTLSGECGVSLARGRGVFLDPDASFQICHKCNKRQTTFSESQSDSGQQAQCTQSIPGVTGASGKRAARKHEETVAGREGDLGGLTGDDTVDGLDVKV